MTVAERDRITDAFAALFYRTGAPFNVTDSAVMRDFIATIRPAYVAMTPSAKSLSGALLTRTYANLFAKLRSWINDAQCYSLVSDGWSNAQNCHFVNYVVIIPLRPPFFFKSECTSGTRQTSETVSAHIFAVISQLGADKCVSVVTDNASNMQGAWSEIETKHPRIFANGCGAHVLNLLVKDLCEMDQFSDVIDKAMAVARFIKERQHVLTYYSDRAREMSIKRKLVLPVATRWFTQYRTCLNLLDAKFAVQSLLDEGAADILKQTKGKEAVEQFKEAVDDPTFWRRLRRVEILLKFPTDILGVLERDESDISMVYHYFMALYDHFADKNKEMKKVFGESTLIDIRALIEKRWDFVHTSSMGFAYRLCPRYMNGKWIGHDKADTRIQFKEYVRTFFGENDDAVRECLKEMRAFMMMPMAVSQERFELYAGLTGIEYWCQFGKTQFPTLAEVATRIFTVPTSSAAAERAWSTYSFLWSKRRNKLAANKVEMLTIIYTNSSLLDEQDKTDYIKQIDIGELFADDIEDGCNQIE